MEGTISAFDDRLLEELCEWQDEEEDDKLDADEKLNTGFLSCKDCGLCKGNILNDCTGNKVILGG